MIDPKQILAVTLDTPASPSGVPYCVQFAKFRGPVHETALRSTRATTCTPRCILQYISGEMLVLCRG